MSNIIRNTTSLAMHIVKEYVSSESTVIDATCGNGHDTLNLARLYPAKLLAFDIQESAVENTVRRLSDNGFTKQLQTGSIRVINDSHENLTSYVLSGGINTEEKQCIDAVVFNLGYLPGGDKAITTYAGSTLNAVKTALSILKRDGIICVTMYGGHPEGKAEKDELVNFAQNLDSHIYHTAYINMLNQPNDPPEILLITIK